ncbi:Hypothetical protein PROPJV5_0192 [Propionibacterium ruminifibrarum]|uniref:Uncharacterized protein n=1 Tax=Propionibacterium ruminifibrarum TaxID=1962131 RepID=A0A375I0S6_9ACTN|nr:hypothetical protein [Propionibacterium ruminifibrarum]SPF67182.1 Hypothetical protein PROPJV5_0192 [Propionibacterium ruminifibrarum]
MGVGFMVITVTSDQHMLDAEAFLRHARQKWPGCRTFEDDPAERISDAEVNVSPVGAPSFTVIHFPNDMISVDGNLDQSAAVAAWVRSLHPDPDLVLWYVDEGFTGHAVLFPGITAEQVASGWVDHGEHDPFEEYPDYFR